MKKEYDFSKGVRGKFYKKNLKLNLPVYLEDENLKFVEKIAQEKNTDLNTIVNDLIKENIKIEGSPQIILPLVPKLHLGMQLPEAPKLVPKYNLGTSRVKVLSER